MSNPIINNLKQTQQPNAMSLLLNMMNGGKSNQMLMNMAMGMLQKQNPQAFQQVQQLMNSGANPEELVKQELKNRSPEEIQQIKKMASSYGVPKEVIDKLG